jgi:hypothetical protein
MQRMTVSIDEITVPDRAAGRYAVTTGPGGALWLTRLALDEPPAGQGWPLMTHA